MYNLIIANNFYYRNALEIILLQKYFESMKKDYKWSGINASYPE